MASTSSETHVSSDPSTSSETHVSPDPSTSSETHVSSDLSTSSQTHACPGCSYTFHKKIDLDDHIAKKHYRNPKCTDIVTHPFIGCGKCNFQTVIKINFIEHMKTHNPAYDESVEYECYQCNLYFPIRADLKGHFQACFKRRPVAGRKKFECCGERLRNKGELDLHIIRHHPHDPNKTKFLTNSMFPCDFCNTFQHAVVTEYIQHCISKHRMEFIQKTDHHYERIPPLQEYECSRCFMKMSSYGYEMHVCPESGIPEYRCPECNALYYTKILLDEHIAEIHQDEGNVRPFITNSINQCKLCSHYEVRGYRIYQHLLNKHHDELFQENP